VNATATIIGAAIIAAALIFTARWEISSAGPGAVFRLDRWTGEIMSCYQKECFLIPGSRAY